MVFCMVKIRGVQVFGYEETLHTTSERVQSRKPAEGHAWACFKRTGGVGKERSLDKTRAQNNYQVRSSNKKSKKEQ